MSKHVKIFLLEIWFLLFLPVIAHQLWIQVIFRRCTYFTTSFRRFHFQIFDYLWWKTHLYKILACFGCILCCLGEYSLSRVSFRFALQQSMVFNIILTQIFPLSIRSTLHFFTSEILTRPNWDSKGFFNRLSRLKSP